VLHSDTDYLNELTVPRNLLKFSDNQYYKVTNFTVLRTNGADTDYIRVYVYTYKCLTSNCRYC